MGRKHNPAPDTLPVNTNTGGAGVAQPASPASPAATPAPAATPTHEQVGANAEHPSAPNLGELAPAPALEPVPSATPAPVATPVAEVVKESHAAPVATPAPSAEVVPAVEAPAISGAPKVGTQVLVANQHTGAIVFPRKGAQGMLVNPLILPAGQVTLVDAEEWELRKSNRVVQHYLDMKLLAVVNVVSPVPVLENTSTNLPIPEHLQTEEELGQMASAKVRKQQSLGSIDV